MGHTSSLPVQCTYECSKCHETFTHDASQHKNGPQPHVYCTSCRQVVEKENKAIANYLYQSSTIDEEDKRKLAVFLGYVQPNDVYDTVDCCLRVDKLISQHKLAHPE